jgi:hypothetical protein
MAITDVIKIKEMVKAQDKGRRLEEELRMTEKIEPGGYSSGMPHGNGPYWNQRTPEDQYQSQREVLKDQGIIEYMRDNQQQEMMMNYLMEMFNENPTKFEQQFGNEAAETMRMMQGFKTKQHMEEQQGKVFEPGTSEIIGQKASFSPDQVALGTLPTDQSDKFQTDDANEFIRQQLLQGGGKELDAIELYENFKNQLLQDQLTEEVTPYREVVTDMNEDISGILKNLPKEIWYNLLDKIKPYYLDELDMMLLHEGVDFDSVLKEERLIDRGSKDWNKLQKLKEELRKQSEAWEPSKKE